MDTRSSSSSSLATAVCLVATLFILSSLVTSSAVPAEIAPQPTAAADGQAGHSASDAMSDPAVELPAARAESAGSPFASLPELLNGLTLRPDDSWTVVLIATAAMLLIALVLVNRGSRARSLQELEMRVRQRTVDLRAREAAAQHRSRTLARERDEALAASEAKSQFLARISHEIRTPMNGVIGIADLLLRSDLDAKQRAYAETLRDTGLSLVRIVSEVLDYSKIEAGKVILQAAPFSVGRIVDDTCRLFAAEAERRGLQLRTEIDESLPEKVTGDVLRIGEILANLLSNAIKFSGDGSVTICCTLADNQPEHHDRLALRFEVRDQGIGIPEDAQAGLFERYVQANGSSPDAAKGTGLGLAICRELVMLMGGRIGVRSAPGQGSTFWFTIICEHVESAPAAETAHDEAADAVPAMRGEAGLRGHALVADDNPVNRMVTQGLLEEIGLTVDLAEDGRQALEKISCGDYDLLILDIQMPQLGGLAVARKVRSSEVGQRPLPILALSANVSRTDRDAALAAGADDYLVKPVTLNTLQSALARLLEGEQLCRKQTCREDRDTSSPVHLSAHAVLDEAIVRDLGQIRTPGGNLLTELATCFVNQLPAGIRELRAAFEQADAMTVRQIAHRLRGTSQQLGMRRLARALADVEAAAAEEDGLDWKIAVVAREFEIAEQALQSVPDDRTSLVC